MSTIQRMQRGPRSHTELPTSPQRVMREHSPQDYLDENMRAENFSAPTATNYDDLSILCGCQEPGTNISHFSQRIITPDAAAVQTRIVFEALLERYPQFMSFSQRKFIGFRGRYEFDQKRILVSSGNQISLLGLHPQSERPYKILTCPIPGLKEEDMILDYPQMFEDEESLVQQQTLESLRIGPNSHDQVDDRSEHSQSQRKFNLDTVSLRELDLIRTKEQIVAVSFISDSMPSYILVISKVYKPAATENTQASQDQNKEDATGPPENANQKNEIMFRILSLSTQEEEAAVQKVNEQSVEPQAKANAGAVPIPLEQKTDLASSVDQSPSH